MLTRSNLFGYQADKAVPFIKAHENCALFVDMGLGKTVSGLTAFSDMLREFEVRRALVIAPLRVARRVWSDEIDRWAHLRGLTVAKIVGTPEERMRALRTPADLHTINREQIMWLEAQFIQHGKQIVRWPWDLVFNDECQGFKSQSSKRWDSLKRLRWGGGRNLLFPRMVNLSGTPAPNGYADLWAQFNLLDGGRRLGTSEKAFRDRFFLPATGPYERPILRETAAAEIQAMIADITLSMKAEDYLDLPPVKMNYIRVELSGAAMRKYKELEKKFLMETFSGKTVTAVNAGVLAGKLAQLANGAVYISEREWEPLHDAKLEALPEAIEASNGGPVLLVYSYKHDLTRFAPVLDKMGVRWAHLRADREFDRFRAGELDVGVLHPASAGHGLNDLHLSGAETLIHFGLTNNWEWYGQVNARLTGGHRVIGKNVVIHHIVADGTVDDKLIRLLASKDADEYGLTRALADMAGVRMAA